MMLVSEYISNLTNRIYRCTASELTQDTRCEAESFRGLCLSGSAVRSNRISRMSEIDPTSPHLACLTT
jgi:hypothetical protein